MLTFKFAAKIQAENNFGAAKIGRASNVA